MMKPRSWFEAHRERLVSEYRLARGAHPAVELKLVESRIAWEGETSDIPPGVEAEPLRFRVEYPAGFPAAAIRVTHDGVRDGAITGAEDAVALAVRAKELIRGSRNKYRAKRTHLVLYAPATYCLFPGQR